MDNKYLVVLITALNPSNKQVTSFGEKRLQQYVLGFERISELAEAFPEFDFAVVDNTISEDWKMPEVLQKQTDKIRNLKKVFFNDNEWGSKNKGCGVIVDLKKMFQDIDASKYEYCIYFEPRQFLLDFHFFKEFLKNPGNYFKIDIFRISAKTYPRWVRMLLKFFPFYSRQYNIGLYSLETPLLKQYSTQADLAFMAEHKVSMEEDMYKKLKNKKIKKVKKLGILWHNAFENEYVPY